MGSSAARQSDPRTSLGELARLFLKLGTTSFGGPAAHVAMMENEVVRRRGWLTHEQFLDYIAATNFIPGPNSTELAIHIGFVRAGWPGLIVAGAAFILPATFIVVAIAWAYVRYHALPAADGLLYGIKPVVIAIVLRALWSLGRSALKTPGLALLGIGAVAAAALTVHELAILIVAGVVMVMARSSRRGLLKVEERGTDTLTGLIAASTSRASLHVFRFPVAASVASDAAAMAMTSPISLAALFGAFVKTGSILFGSGYVLFALLRADLVERLHWLTERQLLDAVAVGQVTPGPLFTTATFIGYMLHGLPGAIVATVGIFLPAFVFVAISSPIVPRLRRSPTAAAALDGVNVASLALMAVVTWHLGRDAIVDPITALLAVVSAVLLFRFDVNSAWLVLGGAILGLLTIVA